MLARDIAPGIRLPSEPTPKAFGGVSSAGGFSIPNRSESRFQRRVVWGSTNPGALPQAGAERCAFGAKQIRSCFGSKDIGIAIALRRIGPRRTPNVVRPKSHWRKRPRAAKCVLFWHCFAQAEGRIGWSARLQVTDETDRSNHQPRKET